jgi:hypothetical protein
MTAHSTNGKKEAILAYRLLLHIISELREGPADPPLNGLCFSLRDACEDNTTGQRKQTNQPN